MSGRIAEQTVEAYLRGLASDDPTPGGGAVAALSGATGAALISMVCNLTIGKEAYEDAQERMRWMLEEAETARTELLDLADRDATAFDGVMAAFKMPKETDAEKAVRSKAIQAGYESAARVPLEIAKRAAELMELARETTEIGNAQAASDGACAGQALASAVWCATYNVEINAAALKDAARHRRSATRSRRSGRARPPCWTRPTRRSPRESADAVRRFESGRDRRPAPDLGRTRLGRTARHGRRGRHGADDAVHTRRDRWMAPFHDGTTAEDPAGRVRARRPSAYEEAIHVLSFSWPDTWYAVLLFLRSGLVAVATGT